MAPPKGKGKDLSRMTAPPLASAAPAPVSSLVALSQQSTSGSGGATATASRVPSPRSGNKPKGKDFSRMTGPPSSAVQQQPPATVAVSQPPPAVSSQPPPGTTSFEHLENIRRQNAARVAAGMPPIANPMVGVVARPTPSSVSVDKAKPLVPVNRRVSNHQPLPSQVALASTSYAPPQPQRQQLVVNALVPNTPTQFRQQQQTSVSTHAPKQAPKTVQQTQQQQTQQQQTQQQQTQQQQTQQQQTQQQQTQQQQTQQQQTQQQPLVVKSNVSTNAIIHPITKEVQQPTQRPSWSDARLSTMEGSSSSKAKTSSISKKSQDGYGKPTLAPILGEKLVALCHSIDPSYTLDSEVQERLVEMADSFVEKVTRDATKLAKHRGSNCLDVVDVALALKKGYNMAVPGLGPPSVGAGAGGKGGQGMGGWLFADKVNPGRDEQPKKKRRASGTAAATAAAM